jgi:hypothetical protein
VPLEATAWISRSAYRLSTKNILFLVLSPILIRSDMNLFGPIYFDLKVPTRRITKLPFKTAIGSKVWAR